MNTTAPIITSFDIRNDAFRNALNAIAHKAVPKFNIEYAYYSDMLWDANCAAEMAVGDTAYITVRDMGTWWFANTDELARYHARKHAEENRGIVLSITRKNYDRFDVIDVTADVEATDVTEPSEVAHA